MGRVHAVVPWIALAACGRVGFDPRGDGAGGGGDDGPASPKDVSADCPAIGDVCLDGTVYVGMTPDGNVPMFTEPSTNYGGPWSFGSGGAPMIEVLTNQTNRVTGAANTAALSLGGAYQDADAGAAGIQLHEAANYCTDLVFGGHNDWYLPAFNELQVLFANATPIAGWVNDEYWTSNEDPSCPTSCALLIDYPAATEVNFRNKYDYRAARCVRK